MSSHAVNAFGSDARAFFKSAGSSWTTPPEIFFCGMGKPFLLTLPRREQSVFAKKLRRTFFKRSAFKKWWTIGVETGHQWRLRLKLT